ncbi:inositol monophosphatase family protein [Haloferax chudinovii]|uniref:fructose-bisphosphatase n=1 Tax=Haloferax chudinovii TaxID=1109010 RepID=A0ABD5XHD2_9EURY
MVDDRYLWTAIRAAEVAGDELRARFESGSHERFRDRPADEAAEERIIDVIAAAFPDDNIVSEEGSPEFRPKPRWVVDPLDGTVNFHNGVPHFSVSIMYEGATRPDVGVVNYVPADQLYVAIEGEGAFVNGRELSVSNAAELSDALVVTGFDSLARANGDGAYLEALCESTRGVRRMGSAAAELALVAAGRFDVYFEQNLDMWDTRTGPLLVREAGGEVTHVEAIDDVTGDTVVASNQALHRQVISLMSRHSALG